MSALLKKLEVERDAACLRLGDAMRLRHPIGSRVHVLLSSVQMRPSPAEVMHADGSTGCYCVRLDGVNRRGNQTVKRVHWSKVTP